MGIAERQCALINILLDLLKQRRNNLHHIRELNNLLLLRIATGNFDGSILEVTWTYGQSHRHTLQFPLGEFESGLLRVAVIELHRQAELTQCFYDLVNLNGDSIAFFRIAEDGNYNDVDRRQFRRQHQAIIVRVSHDQGTHQTGAYTPGSSPNVIEPAIFTG